MYLRNMCLEIYDLDPAKFLSASRLEYHSTYRHAKANYKYMKDYDKIKESSYLQHWHVKKFVWFGNVTKAFSK